MNNVRKTIYDYDDYRVFLKDFYLRSKAENTRFSFRYFSRLAGMSSPTALKRVMEGERSLSPRGIAKFAKAMKLGIDETFFFQNLVFFTQAKSSERKQFYAAEIMRSRGYKRQHPLHESQFNYFKHWYFPLIRELVSLPGFREEPAWIAKKIRPQITEHEARRALEELVKLGLLCRDSQGKLILAQPHLATGSEVVSSSVIHYHREILKRASDSIDLVPREMRDLSTIAFVVSKEKARKIKEKIQKFRKEIIEEISHEKKADCVYQLSFQFFPFVWELDDKDGE